jgi:hypothetical protein
MRFSLPVRLAYASAQEKARTLTGTKTVLQASRRAASASPSVMRIAAPTP